MKKNYNLHYLVWFLFFCILFHKANAQWQQTNGPYGGTIRALQLNGNNLFAGTNGAGVFLSSDNGSTWKARNTGLSDLNVRSFAVSSTNLFAGTQTGGVFLSTDNGTSWKSMNSGLTNLTITSFAVSGSNIFAGTSGGVFLSTDNGTSWKPLNSSGLTNLSINSLVLSGNNLFAGTSGGIFLSSDNGITWKAMNSGLPDLYISSFSLNGTSLYVGTIYGLYVSSNNGLSWQSANTGLTNRMVFSFVASGTSLFAGTDQGVFISTDNGATWTARTAGISRLNINTLIVNGSSLFAGSTGGVFLSGDNGLTWNTMSAGITGLSVSSLAISGSNLFAGTNISGVFLSGDNGASWQAINSGLPDLNILSLAVSGTRLFAGTSSGLYFSDDKGLSWQSGNSGLINSTINALTVSGLNLFAGTNGGGVFLSTDNGASWKAMNSGLANTGINSLFVSGGNLYAGTFGGGVFFSGDYGASWIAINSGLGNMNVKALMTSGIRLFAGTISGLFISADNGTSWNTINSALAGQNIQSLAMKGNNLFAGTDVGVFLSSDNGSTWNPMNTGLTNLSINTLLVNGTTLFAGTGNGGVFKASTFTASIQKTDAICTGATTGSAIVTANGGQAPYTYSWNTNPVQTTATAQNLPAGTDTVTIKDANGTITKAAVTIFVKSSPPADFFQMNGTSFTVNTVLKSTGYYWDFGDNTYASGSSISHNYSAPGVYQVTLKAMDSTVVYCQSSKSQFITSGTGGCTTISDFSFSQDTTAKTVNFTDKSTGKNLKWYWDFGNGESSLIQNPTGYKYLKGGAYTVCLTVRDTVQGCQHRRCNDLIANKTADCPAKFLFFTDGVSTKVQFDGKSSNTARSYFWAFGNGDYSSQANPEYTYPVKGFYNVCLTIRDSIIFGCQSRYCETIHAGSGDCKAKFTSLPDAAMNVSFSDASLGNPTAWYWDFGDGHVSHLQSPGYKYAAPGFYSVCLTVSTTGCQDTYCATVHVGNADCKTAFSYFTDPATMTTAFKDLSLSSPSAWSWEFGDGTISTLQNPEHVYINAGTYTSCLTTKNASGCISHYCENLTMGPFGTDCQAGFETFEQNNTATFKNTSKGWATTWFWDFGDQNYSTQKNPTHTYSSDGYYQVSLTMYNPTGGSCFNTFFKSVSIGTAAQAKDCAAKFSYIANTTTNAVTFRDECIGGATSWSWNFGDTTALSTANNPTHTYKKPGFYQVCLTIQSSNGTSNVYCNEIGIGQTGLGANFVYKDNNTYFFKNNAVYPISFYGSAYGKPSKWKWSFGDNSYDSLRINVIHNYLSAGSYNACLTISNPLAKLSNNYCKLVKVGTVQGIKENIDGSIGLDVYPNPLTGPGIVSYFIEQNSNIQLSLYDLQGRKVKTFASGTQGGKIHQAIDVSDPELVQGMYLIHLTINEKSYLKPLIINR